MAFEPLREGTFVNEAGGNCAKSFLKFRCKRGKGAAVDCSRVDLKHLNEGKFKMSNVYDRNVFIFSRLFDNFN